MSGRCSRSINVIHRPSPSWIVRVTISKIATKTKKGRRKKVTADEISRFACASSRQGNFYQEKKMYLNREREREIRKINQKERETGRGIKGKLREEIETPSIETKRTDTRHVVRDHATDRARSNNFQGGSFRRKCVEARSSSLHYRCLAMPPNHRAER